MIDKTEAKTACKELAEKLKIEIKILNVAEDKNGLTFEYLTPEKTDFRPLVRELNRKFKVKINLNLLSPGEAVKYLPGYAECGTRLCWITDMCENLYGCKYKEVIEKEETEKIPEEKNVDLSINREEPEKKLEEVKEVKKEIEEKKPPKRLIRRLVLK